MDERQMLPRARRVPLARARQLADSADRPPFSPLRLEKTVVSAREQPGTFRACALRVTAPRAEVRGATMALARRTNLRKAMLAPWDPLVDRIWWYALALAQQRTGVAVHQSTLVLNHHHTEVTSTEPNLPVFRRILHGQVSKALNTLLAKHRYDQIRQLWDDRRTHAMRLLDAEGQAAHMIYSHVNCVAAGLVRAPEDMPGWTFDFGVWKSGPIWVSRPDIYFDPTTHPDRLPLRFTPPPLLYREFDGDLDALVHHMRKLTETAIERLHGARKGRPVLGVRKLRRLHPWSEPRSLRARGGELVPTFKIGARGLASRELNVAACVETSRFRNEYRDARLRDLSGEDVEFPHGTYLMRVQHGARVARPRGDELVFAVGLTLEEIKTRLTEGEGATKHDRRTLIDRVRDAFTEEAGELVESDELFVDPPGQTTTDDDQASPTGSRALVQHRFAEMADNDLTRVSRVVVLRDARRGRPARKVSDPPPA